MAQTRIDEHYLSDEQREARRRQRILEMRRRKRRQELIRKYAVHITVAAVVCIVALFIGARALILKIAGSADNGNARNMVNKIADLESFQTELSHIEVEQAQAMQTEDGQAQAAQTEDGQDIVSRTEDTQTQEAQSESVEPEAARQNSKKNDTSVNVSASIINPQMGVDVEKLVNERIAGFNEQYINPLGGLISHEPPLSASATDATESFGADIISENGVLIDVENGTIIAQRDSRARIVPASMTKILTVLVAAESVTNLDDTFTITLDITDYSFVHDCSNAGFSVGENVTVRDLFYGTVLPSGADAALALAVYVAGSHEAFVEMMNEKIDELGLSDTTHFTNCVGIYDEDHYSTVYDMAVILKAAADNSFCREVLSEHIYTTTATSQHPDGIELSNWFLRRIEDKDTHGEVICAKTGYVVQSGNCAASLAADADGKEYICVTAKSTSSWRCIYDHVALYERYL